MSQLKNLELEPTAWVQPLCRVSRVGADFPTAAWASSFFTWAQWQPACQAPARVQCRRTRGAWSDRARASLVPPPHQSGKSSEHVA